MNDPRESMEGAPLLGTPKAAYSNVPKRLASSASSVSERKRSSAWKVHRSLVAGRSFHARLRRRRMTGNV